MNRDFQENVFLGIEEVDFMVLIIISDLNLDQRWKTDKIQDSI